MRKVERVMIMCEVWYEIELTDYHTEEELKEQIQYFSKMSDVLGLGDIEQTGDDDCYINAVELYYDDETDEIIKI